jgi:hypothetical protein
VIWVWLDFGIDSGCYGFFDFWWVMLEGDIGEAAS